jgi:hypothetical protein
VRAQRLHTCIENWKLHWLKGRRSFPRQLLRCFALARISGFANPPAASPVSCASSGGKNKAHVSI